MRNPTGQVKRLWRRAARALRASLPEAYRREAEAGIVRNLRDLVEAAGVREVGVYAPLPGEVDLALLYGIWEEEGKTLLWPRVERRGAPLVYRPARRSELVPGAYGVWEPPPGPPAALPELLLVPGLLFSRTGYRLGYGGGYYDRTLSTFSGRAVGVSFSALLFADVPRDPWDVQLGEIVTEREALSFRRGANFC
ncbi:MAG: 5-formyltetrahydrofolate cyclo-ligase [Brockia lithotrophica]|uniref:5-formyltetrahydrofolate cyclo-ligase n=1 Tax=Brockia lithotrophica TaxID=933949 RepID=A0A2T5GAU4_9BACL|nr:5-formyltetrahydrofolate cyclo-ligase [Brockia lithotrophica]PTQ53278.1 MAG: 5-formyltetrahydrofolate cyclo-ligase [Brockia lithotrophica]